MWGVGKGEEMKRERRGGERKASNGLPRPHGRRRVLTLVKRQATPRTRQLSLRRVPINRRVLVRVQPSRSSSAVHRIPRSASLRRSGSVHLAHHWRCDEGVGSVVLGALVGFDAADEEDDELDKVDDEEDEEVDDEDRFDDGKDGTDGDAVENGCQHEKTVRGGREERTG